MSILVAKHIKRVLSADSLKAKVGDRVFLEGLNRETEFPFVVYTYSVTAGEGTKDADSYNCQTEVFVFSREGDTSLEIADEIRKLLEHSKGEYDQFEVVDTEFVSYEGSLDEDIYTRKLVFNIITC